LAGKWRFDLLTEIFVLSKIIICVFLPLGLAFQDNIC